MNFFDNFKVNKISFTDIYCYCLMPNHFHFLITSKDEIPEFFSTIQILDGQFKLISLHFFTVLMTRFELSINKTIENAGLLMHTYKHKPIYIGKRLKTLKIKMILFFFHGKATDES